MDIWWSKVTIEMLTFVGLVVDERAARGSFVPILGTLFRILFAFIPRPCTIGEMTRGVDRLFSMGDR